MADFPVRNAPPTEESRHVDVLILMQGMVPEPGRAVTGNGLP